jgi:hypothetical protein
MSLLIPSLAIASILSIYPAIGWYNHIKPHGVIKYPLTIVGYLFLTGTIASSIQAVLFPFIALAFTLKSVISAL